MDGTSVNAETAARALGVVEDGEVVVHCNCAVRAGARTFLTADTAVGAHLAGESALIVVGATDSDDNAVFLHLDSSVRTVLSAKSATGTEARNDLCNAVVYDDGIVGTSRSAVTKTNACIGTYVFAFPMLCCLAAGLKSCAKVLFVLLGSFAGTMAADVSKLLNCYACFNAENACDSLRGRVAAGNAEVGLADLAFGECAGIAVASAVAASTAVSSGERITDSEEFFVFLNTEKDVRNGKYDRANSRDSETDKNRDNNFHCFASLREKIFNDSRKAVERHCNDRSGDKGYGKSAEALGGIGIVELGTYAREEEHSKQEAETYAE